MESASSPEGHTVRWSPAHLGADAPAAPIPPPGPARAAWYAALREALVDDLTELLRCAAEAGAPPAQLDELVAGWRAWLLAQLAEVVADGWLGRRRSA